MPARHMLSTGSYIVVLKDEAQGAGCRPVHGAEASPWVADTVSRCSGSLRHRTQRIHDQGRRGGGEAAGGRRRRGVRQPEPALPHRGRAGAQATASWGLDRIDQRDLPLDDSYTLRRPRRSEVTAYVIDTGVSEHTEFGGRRQPGTTSSATTTSDRLQRPRHARGRHRSAAATYGVAKDVNLRRRAGPRLPTAVAPPPRDRGHRLGRRERLRSLGGQHEPRRPGRRRFGRGGAGAIQAGITFGVAAGNESSDASGSSPGSGSRGHHGGRQRPGRLRGVLLELR